LSFHHKAWGLAPRLKVFSLFISSPWDFNLSSDIPLAHGVPGELGQEGGACRWTKIPGLIRVSVLSVTSHQGLWFLLRSAPEPNLSLPFVL
jgi:hypothetical protein